MPPETEQTERELYNVVPNFDDAKDFSPFPDRQLRCTVRDITGFMSKGRDGKTPIAMVKWQFEVQEDFEYTNDMGEKANAKGRVLFRATPAQGPGASFLKKVLKGLNYDPLKFRLPDSKVELLGKEVIIGTKLDTGVDPPINKPDTFTAVS
jgi:hypothetical protein